ncbi:hypothetical protein V1517DRAFT_37227 [Lipomyces orientalis]|uniref:Uncharacterized protein n=1 Tax=Lipomyces orientalis TaxID=1233043 RepID=A0ACC3TFH1_9ASCO
MAYSQEQSWSRPGLKVPDLTWYRHAGLRTLYLKMPILMVCATVNGYDGSLLNGLQTMHPWQKYFGNPCGSTLGLFTAIMKVEGFSALFISPYIADLFGRRIGTAIGVLVMFIGVILQVVPGTNRGMFIGVGVDLSLALGKTPSKGKIFLDPERSRLTEYPFNRRCPVTDRRIGLPRTSRHVDLL